MSVAFMFQIFYAGYHGKNEGVFIETEFFSQPDLLLFICCREEPWQSRL